MLKEEFLQQLLATLYESESINVYDHIANQYSIQSEAFANTKPWADQLVREKLATYSDTEHTILQITNYGRYWILKGGYETFLKEGQFTKERKDKTEEKVELLRKEKEELMEARLRLTHYRLVGFWLTIVISSLGFLFSLYNLFMWMREK